MIKEVKAREILDSRGNPTVEVTISDGEYTVSASVPSGASTGAYEAVELRDNEERFSGRGVNKAIHNVVNIIGPAIQGMDPASQDEIDRKMLELDGTPNKANLGANATLGVSLAVARLAAKRSGQPLYLYLKNLASVKVLRSSPYLYMNFINGGKHAHSPLKFQEYHVVPMTDSIEEGILIGHKVQSELKKTITSQYGSISSNIGDEGGFVPDIKNPEEPLKLIMETVGILGLTNKVKLAMDVAADSFYNPETGKYMISDDSEITAEELSKVYKKMVETYPILSIEDPFFEEDFDHFAKLRQEIEASGTFLVGDDLTVTNMERLEKANMMKSIGGIIIKPNQIGTLTETIKAIKYSLENNINPIVSHRSGETNDDFIADLAFAFGVFGIKAGALQRGERVAKYNRLKEIQNGL